MVVNREHSGMTPMGMKFSTLAGSVGGGTQTPGFLGVGRLYLASPKFISYEGGIKRIVWMPKELKEAMRDGIERRAAEEGLNGFVDKIGDEDCCVTAEQLVAHLAQVEHPAMSMDPIF